MKDRKKGKLYKQWVDKGALPAEALQEEVAEDTKSQKADGSLSRLHVLYIFLGVSVVILIVGLALLIMQSC